MYLSSVLRGYNQCVTCKTRKQALLDPFFCNVVNSCKCTQLSPIKNSGHNMICMIPKYKPKLKQRKRSMHKKVLITETAAEKLNDCFYIRDGPFDIQGGGGGAGIFFKKIVCFATWAKKIKCLRQS